MNYNDIAQAREDARSTLAYADAATRHAANLIQDRLRAAQIDKQVLKALKRELRDFNANTGKWKP